MEGVDVDPDSFDPELRFARFYSIASAALGVISFCGGVIPICGGVTGVVGIVLGLLSLRTEKSKLATFGVGISILGIITTLVYTFILFFSQGG